MGLAGIRINGVLWAAIGWLAVAGQGTAPDQFVLLDVLHTHTTKTKGFTYFPIPPDVPENWKSPFNFHDGTIHFRLEVVDKPSDLAVNYQLCVFQDRHSRDKHACDGTRRFTGCGVLEWKGSPASMWQSKVIDWSRKLMDMMLVIKDGAGRPVDDRYGFGGKWEGSPDFSLYFPMTVRFTAVAVAKGGSYNPGVLHWRVGGMHWKDLVHLKALAVPWQRGQLGSVLVEAEKESESKVTERAEEARRVVAAFREHIERRKKELEAIREAVPDYAAGDLSCLGQLFAPAAIGRDLLAEARRWEQDPVVVKARKARAILDSIEEASRRVRGKGKATDPAFAQRYAGELRLIAQAAARLKREYPETPSCRQALGLAAGLGLPVPE